MLEGANKMLTNLQIAHGDNFVTDNGIMVKHPKLEELIKFSVEDVYSFTRMFCLKPHDIMVELWANGIDFELLTDFDLLVTLYYNKKEVYDKLFYEFMNIYSLQFFENESEKWLIGYDEENIPIAVIDEKTRIEISEFFKKITCFENTKRTKWANEQTKRKILDLSVEAMDDKKNEDDLHMYVSALVWGNTCGYNWDNVWNLYFYQFNTGLRHLDKIKQTSALLSGYYAGTIDVKKVPKKELDWKVF